ncbi:putative trans-sialidase, Group VI [Trypanosoma cruzi]|uniref:Trans-sialidase, putative n=2 Tax=Trypanosoma cruzi TaxID=5693 RepID=Q4D781_TRYCC|nr:trans-sialidase, putative [Trypanosoma cruzi]EAN88386.1 trans-sialidase, putative [Trypanosoma cruzi]PWV01152.1 putative trans-sialidase, Group VI [Trypanosoma cruzi]RNC34957.1 putative trans-sialidase [Trypanosoma cruzi]|eukprot:XP_810237.1 trans-sialidase [Trypanosoma cruzi strain CL Brener]
MLSRVAAVMAPRTHNRRRVTGSSGRRREGRESEPPRPNMSRDLFHFVLLLLVVMVCGGSGTVTADEVKESVEPKFEWKGITEGAGVTVDSLGAPGLLKVGSDVFAVAEAQCKETKEGKDNFFSGVASQVLTKDNADTPVEVLNEVKETQFLEKAPSTELKKVDLSRPTTVVEGNDIYMLVGKYSRKAATGAGESGADDSGLLLVKGEVGVDESSKGIQWKDTKGLPRTPFCEQHEFLTGLVGGGGSGVKIKDGTLVFPVEGTKKKENEGTEEDEKTVSLIIYTLSTASWTLSKWMSADGCSDPSIVEWKDKLIMMTACDDGCRRVYESGDKGDSWTEALGTLSRVWGKKQDKKVKLVRSGFTTATIDGVDSDKRTVMLVTLPVYSKENVEKGELHLWLTDNAHIVDIGPVSGEGDDAAASSLLYESGKDGGNEKELIALYEKKKGDGKPSPGMVSVLLTEQLERVKEVLATWKEVDKRVSQLCPSKSDAERASTSSTCGAVKITDGLVGLLSGNFSDGTWRDEYLGVNATVSNKEGAEQVDSGVKFTSRGVWAEWPVGSQGENQLYHFANYNFTLVATVSIDNVLEGDTPISVIGVKMNDNGKTVLLGLSYNNKEKKWMLLCGEEKSNELSSPWKPGKTHQLAIVLQNGNQSTAYVDGERVGEDAQCELETTESNEISHFYIGGDGGDAGSQKDVSVTVTNVLLYNRPLNEAEVCALNPNNVPIPPPVGGSAQGTLLQSPSDGQPPLGRESLNENEGVGSGDVSPSAVSTAPPLAGEGSVKQLALRTSLGGSKNVDVVSSPDGDTTVGAEAGDTVPGDRPPQTSAGTPATADANAPTAETVGHVDPAVTTGVSVSSGESGETVGGRDGHGEVHSEVREVNATALNSSLGNLSQGNNSDAGTMRESGLLPSLLLLGLWGLAAL